MTVKILWPRCNRKRIMAGKKDAKSLSCLITRARISSKGKSVGSFNHGGVAVKEGTSRILCNVSCSSKERQNLKNKST